MVDRRVELPVWRVNSQGTEQGVHAEGACFVRNDGYDAFSDAFGPGQVAEQADKGHRGADRLLAASFVEFCVGFGRRQGHVQRRRASFGQETAEGLPTFKHVGDLVRAVLGHEVRQVLEVLVGEVQSDGVPHVVEGRIVGLLLAVRRVSAGEGRPEAVSFDGTGKDDRWLTGVIHCCVVGGVNANRIVPADVVGQGLKVGVGHVRHQSGEVWRVEQLGPNDVPRGGHQALLVAVGQGRETGREGSAGVCGKQGVPRTAPEALDDVPPGPGESGSQFLNDLGVASYGPIEALKVAIHDHGEVVKALTAGHRQF